MKSNKPKYRKAVGIEYNSNSKAPMINIAADAASADTIVKVAEMYGVPVLVRPGLAKALSKVGLDKYIPESLYRAIAIILNQLEKLSKAK